MLEDQTLVACPNVKGDDVGDLYLYPEDAAEVSAAIKAAIYPTPLFVKIGYLPKAKLAEFVEKNADHIDGVVAINTISANLVNAEGKQSLPDAGATSRAEAGVSGWAIKARAQEVAKNLAALKKELYPSLTILAIGGVTEPQDVWDYLSIGVDGVESCTGAFLNPHLGLEVRFEKPNLLTFELEIFRKSLREVIRHPISPAQITVDRETRTVTLERD